MLAALGVAGAAAACSLGFSDDGFTGGDAADGGSDTGVDAAADAAAETASPVDAGVDASIASCDAPGLIAYWNFDEGSGTVANNCAAGGKFTGHLDGAEWTNGIVGKGALKFAAARAAVRIDDGITLLEDGATRSFTITAWVNSTSMGVANLGRFFSKCPPAGCGNALEFLIENKTDGGPPGLCLRLPTGIGGQSQAVDDPNGFPISRIVAVAGVYEETGSSADARVYLDGQLVAGGSITPQRLTTGGAAVLGTRSDGMGDDFVGTLDEMRIFGRVLTDCEIAQLAAKPCK